MKAEAVSDFRNGMPFLGGSQWVDFLNTRFVLGGNSHDFLSDITALRAWAREAGLDSENTREPDESLQARDLRDILARAFELMAQNRKLPDDLLEAVNAALGRLSIHLRLESSGGTPVLKETETVEGCRLTAAIAADFARFLANYEPARLKHCDNPECSMVFYDRGKNSRRRWCSTAICGNRDKVANFRARKAQQPAA